MARRKKNERAIALNQNNFHCNGFRCGILFSFIAAGAISMAISTGADYKTVLAADDIVKQTSESQSQIESNKQKEEGNKSDVSTDSENVDMQARNDGVYDFKDNKTAGTVTVTKKWDDGLTNDERGVPNMSISTSKPSKSTKGYTITFHGNGLKFADGSDENMVVYNSSGQIIEGSYKSPNWAAGAWYSDKSCTQKVEVSGNGIPQVELTGDLDLWAKDETFEVKGYNYYSSNRNDFNDFIPDTVTEIIFTDEVKPESAETIDVDADGDGGVVAWLDDDAGTVMKVSTQIPGVKVQAAKNSSDMFYNRGKIQKIDLKMLDTTNVTDMSYMFYGCSSLTSLNLSRLDTAKVTSMNSMFMKCSSLTSLDLSRLDTTNVTNMNYMFYYCSGLASLDLSHLDTAKATSMASLFQGCFSLKSLDLSHMNTQNVTDMNHMFCRCSGLTSLDLSPLNTINVTNIESIFRDCSNLTSLDLSSLYTSKVTNMSYMFYGCSGLTSLDLSHIDTQNVTDMSFMFPGCSGLTSLDLSHMDTSNVINMCDMFSNCSGLTSLDLSHMDTSNVSNMRDMFSGCSGLTSLDLSHMDTSNVMDMGDMFSDCSGLTSLDLSPLDTSEVTDMSSMFYGCSRLTSLVTGTAFKFVGTDYSLDGTWQNTAGETFNGSGGGAANFPSNVADTYTKIS